MTELAVLALTEIRALILQGKWAPGVKLQPARIAATLNTSTTVVREALTKLTGSGLVTTEHNRGFFVRQLDQREFRDIIELRCLTDGLGASLAIERGDLDWESRVIAAHHKMSRTPRLTPDRSNMTSHWAEAHRAFHLAITEACNFPTLLTLTSELTDLNELFRFHASPRVRSDAVVAAEHAAILEAIIDRDAGAASERIRKHYENGLQKIEDALAEH